MTFHEGDRDKGRVITGSSNFTEAGLQDNLEFNVELKNRSDYEFAIQKFNELWAKSVDVTKDYVTTIEVKSPFAQFTPYELYLKFLYEYFRGELNLPDEIEYIYLPQVQETEISGRGRAERPQSSRRIRRRLPVRRRRLGQDLHVGIAGPAPHRTVPSHCSPASAGREQSRLLAECVSRFPGSRQVCESLGKLESLLGIESYEKLKTVFIDESHRFRTEDTQSYEKLAQICRGKRVVLSVPLP